MATHSSILAQEIPWAEEPGRLHSSWGSQRVGHDWARMHGGEIRVKRRFRFQNFCQMGEITTYFYANKNDPREENLRWRREEKFVGTKFLVLWEGTKSTAQSIHSIWTGSGCKCKVGARGKPLLFSHWNKKQGHQLRWGSGRKGGRYEERKEAIKEFSRTMEERLD